MNFDKSWSLGQMDSVWNLAYDQLRQRVNKDLVSWLLQSISPDEMILVLEAGSGTGSGSSYLSREPNVRLSVALDLDLEALQIARKKDPSLAIVLADIYCLPFATKAFHLVWNSSMMEHLENPEDALREMKRVTIHQGHLFVGVPSSSGPLWFQPLIRKTGLGKWIGTVYNKTMLIQVFQSVELCAKESKRYFLRIFIGVLASNDY